VASPVVLVLWRRLAVAALVVVLAAAGAVTALSFPHSIAYTAPPFRPGYATATDSNVDWGQDLSLLTRWSPAHRPYVLYFGPRGITYRNVPGSRQLLGVRPHTIVGWVAVSASELTSVHRQTLAWLRGYCPVGTLGGSILLYRFTSSPTDAPGGPSPAAVCPGPASRRVSRT
jgi:hypothetical protein